MEESNLLMPVVPNSGYINKVYFNIELNEDSIVNLLENLTFVDGEYYIYRNETDDKGLIIYDAQSKFQNSNVYGYAIYDNMSDNGWIYVSNENLKNFLVTYGATNVWWQTSFSGTINVNSIVYNGGEENDLIRDLVSIKEFGLEEKNILIHPVSETGETNKKVNLFPKTKVGNLLDKNGLKYNMPNVVCQQGELFMAKEDGSADNSKKIFIGAQIIYAIGCEIIEDTEESKLGKFVLGESILAESGNELGKFVLGEGRLA